MSSRRSGLGKGLEALIPSHPEGEGGFAVIRVDRVASNPQQPRRNFDSEAMAGLAASISQVGILQPIVVREAEDGSYVLIAGERRLRAAKDAGLEEIPALIRAGDDSETLTEALIENVQREDLGPLELAAGYQQLMEDFGLKHEEIASQVGKSRSAITNTIRLLGLPASVQALLERREITAGHARALIGLEDRAYAEQIASKAAADGWSVRQVEDAVRARSEGGAPQPSRVKAVRPAAIIELEQRLTDRLEVPVKIDYRSNKGKVVIRFGTLDDLERIYRYLFGSENAS